MKRPELLRLAKPFPDKFVAKKEGASYVNHAIVQQRLLATVGPFDMRVDHIIRGPFDEKVTGTSGSNPRTWPARDDAVVGVVLSCTFTIDGQQVTVSEVGTPEGYYMADHDGDRLKKAMSDALKRCAMRVGVGLDLWSKGTYVLPAILEKDIEAEQDAPAPDHDAPDPDDVTDEDSGADRSGGDDGSEQPPDTSWRQVMEAAGVDEVDLMARLIKRWPKNDTSAAPRRTGEDMDRAAGKRPDLVMECIVELEDEKRGANA